MRSDEINYILGLDIGTNSIGWAVLECEKADGQWFPVVLEDLNSYIFQSGVDGHGKPQNAERRQNRLMRRQIDRRAARRRSLANFLKANGLLPDDWSAKSPDNASVANKIDSDFADREMPEGGDITLWANPFAIRAFGLEHILEAYELGRVFMHLQSHRGYFSNRGAKYTDLLDEVKKEDIGDQSEDGKENGSSKEESEEEKERKKEIGQVKAGIDNLKNAMKAQESRTLGEYVWNNPQDGHVMRISRIGFYAERKMVKDEFDQLCKRQEELRKQKGKKPALKPKVWAEIRKKIFDQLPAQSPPPPSRRLPHLRYNAVGDCSIFHKQRQRAAKARLEAQELRIRAVICNIRANGKPLTGQQRNDLFAAANDPDQLRKDGRLPWPKVREIVRCENLNDKDIEGGLVGNRTARLITEAIGPDFWMQMGRNEYLASDVKMQKTISNMQMRGLNQQYALVEDLLSYTSKLGLYKRLCEHWQLPEVPEDQCEDSVALKTAKVELEPGYMKYSAKAINRMLEYMRSSSSTDAPMNEHDARKKVTKDVPSRKRRRNEKLWELSLKDLPDTANPRVERALFAMRRVVNAIIRRYGMPCEIRLEMARDMKASKKHRAEIEAAQRRNRKRNVEVDKKLREEKMDVRRSNRERYKMWHDEQGCECIYCGQFINNISFFGGGAEIDHILPQASFSQNYGNTVVACTKCNRIKGKRTPWQAFGGDEVKWEGIMQRTTVPKKQKTTKTGLPYDKCRRIRNQKNDFLSDEKGFVERALNDTRYIIAATAQCLQKTGIKVTPGRGQATAILRHRWKLNNVLPRYPDDEQPKNRRDHRHHAIDAFVVAMTGHKMLTNLTKAQQLKQDGMHLSASEPKKCKLLEQRNQLLKQVCEPQKWKGGVIHHAVKEKLSGKVVGLQKMPRVRSALHLDGFYARGFYDKEEVIKAPKDARKLLSPDALFAEELQDGNFVADAKTWQKLQEWLREQNSQKTPLPEELKKVRVKKPCYTIRQPIMKVLISKTIFDEWRAGGRGYWIVDRAMHGILQDWLLDNGLSKNSTQKDLEVALKVKPPRMPSKKSGAGNLIHSVRQATVKSAKSVRTIHKFHVVELQNNSHAEVFRCRKENGEYEYKDRVIRAIDAARRIAQKENIVDDHPDDSWGKGWELAFSLSENDMVRFDADKMSEKKSETIQQHEKNFGCPAVYRVQTISQGDYTFRHHSVSGVGDDHGKLRIKSANDLRCVKIKSDVLGYVKSADDKEDS